jgi:hypothetical protein
MRIGRPNSTRQKYAHLLVQTLTEALEVHDQRCQICYLIEECEHRKALRWWRGQWKQRTSNGKGAA